MSARKADVKMARLVVYRPFQLTVSLTILVVEREMSEEKMPSSREHQFNKKKL